MRVISPVGIKAVMPVIKERFEAEKRYQAAMAVARRMLQEGLITEEEYRQFDTKMTEKYNPIFGTLFAEIT